MPRVIGLVKGTCGVCGVEAEGSYCAEHSDADSRPPLDEWVGLRTDKPPFDPDSPSPVAGSNGSVLADAPPDKPPETPPAFPRRRRKFGEWVASKRAQVRETAKPVAKPKAKTAKRISLSGDISSFYSGIGSRLEHTVHYPAGRMMTYQAAGAGVVLDQAIAGTMVDRLLLQPIWRSKETWEQVSYLVGPPVLLIMMQNLRIAIDQANAAGNIQLANDLNGRLKMLAEGLAWILRGSLLSLAPAMAEAERRREEEAQAIREAFPAFDHDGMDPVDLIMQNLFAPPGAPMPEEAVQHGA